MSELPAPAVPTMTWLGHATALLELGGVRLLTDPVLRDRVAFLRRVEGSAAATDLARVGVVLLSHLHHDHCDVASLRSLGPDVLVIAPPGSGSWLRSKGLRRVVELALGATTELDGVEVTAVPAAHDGMRVPFGPRAAAVGYVVRAAGTQTYFAGDTDLFASMRDIADEQLDLALLPVWGWGTSLGPGHLDPAGAADAVELLAPTLAVPIHWGTLLPVSFRALHRRAREVLTRPPLRFAAEVARRGSTTGVVVAEPGRPVRISP